MHKVVHLSRYAPTALFGISAKVTFSAPLVAACPANNLNVLVVATPVSVPSISMVYHIVMVESIVFSRYRVENSIPIMTMKAQEEGFMGPGWYIRIRLKRLIQAKIKIA
ncbi:Uncharacterized protein HZ326_20187 [Fusarium oxysporum f. sp. albedinis]|nr:Uncharacterized protein HZ326_20187 [Fusarium oxysporum f. sp. albedinis]